MAEDARWYAIQTYSGHENKVKKLIEHKIAAEGEGSVGLAVQVTVLAAPAGFDGRITFTGFGIPTDNPYSLDVTNPTLGACAPGGPARCPASP